MTERQRLLCAKLGDAAKASGMLDAELSVEDTILQGGILLLSLEEAPRVCWPDAP